MAQAIDFGWATNVLQDWAAEANNALGWDRSNPREFPFCASNPVTDRLRFKEHQTSEVVMAVLGRTERPILMRYLDRGFIELRSGIDLVNYTVGVIETIADTRAHIVGNPAPTMAADALHPTIWEAASKLWADGHYGQAVQRAATFLNAHLQDLCGRHDVSDSGLMSQVFSVNPPEPGRPRLRWPGDDNDLTVKAMRTGLLQFSQGCFMAIRNPATHTTDEISKQVALEQLATLSTLARWVDVCELVEALEN